MTYRAFTIDTFISKNAVIHLVTISAILDVPKIIPMLGVFDEAAQFARSCEIVQRSKYQHLETTAHLR